MAGLFLNLIGLFISEVSTAVVFEITVFWNFTSCHLVDEDFASPLYSSPL